MSSVEDGQENIVIISADRHLKLNLLSSSFNNNLDLAYFSREYIENVLNKLGEESAEAQNLQVPITTSNKLTSNSCDDLVFIVFNANGTANGLQNLNELGFIRFGTRDLYVASDSSLKRIPNCPSILDFYIRPKRCGYGKVLFDLLLEQLHLNPQKLAYDRPSISMISFLKKHFSLDKPRWQHNHYVIFDPILNERAKQSHTRN